MIAVNALMTRCTTLRSAEMQDGLLMEDSLRIGNPFG